MWLIEYYYVHKRHDSLLYLRRIVWTPKVTNQMTEVVMKSKLTPILEDEPEDIQISRILDKLFCQYASNTKFLTEALKRGGGIRDYALMLIIKCAKKTVYFGAKITKDGAMVKMKQDEFDFNEEGQVKTTTDATTFTRILVGWDERHLDAHGKPIPYSLNYAWGANELIFEGKSVYIHRQLMEDMFTEFRCLIGNF